MKLIFVISLMLFLRAGFSQTGTETVMRLEDTLVKMMKETRAETDRQAQKKLNDKFENMLRRTLRYDEAFTFNFDKLSKMMSTEKSPDGAFRIFNWNLEIGAYQEQKFYCLIMKKNTKTNDFEIIELVDKSSSAPYKIEYAQLNEKKWYGALYFKIVPIEKPFGGTIYTMLGWDGNNMVSNKKLIETMQFNKSDGVKFGFPIFKDEDDKTKRRIIFEYSKESSMTIRLHEGKKNKKKKRRRKSKSIRLVFDHLTPANPAVDLAATYVADGTYDAFELQGNKWVYVIDVDARTGKKFKTRYNAPKPVNGP